MTTEIAMRREGSHLVPYDEVAASEVSSLPTTNLLVTVRSPRNLRQFRLAWALAQKVSEAVDFLHDRETAMIWLKIKSRHLFWIQDPRTLEVRIVPKSIAFGSLRQDAFNRLFNRMIYVTCSEIVPGLEEGALRAEIEAMVGAEIPRQALHKPAHASKPKPSRSTHGHPTGGEA